MQYIHNLITFCTKAPTINEYELSCNNIKEYDDVIPEEKVSYTASSSLVEQESASKIHNVRSTKRIQTLTGISPSNTLKIRQLFSDDSVSSCSRSFREDGDIAIACNIPSVAKAKLGKQYDWCKNQKSLGWMCYR